MSIRSFIKNIAGWLNGFGGCYRCGDRWNWKKAVTVNYSDTSGSFPLCKECWDETDIYGKMVFFRMHFDKTGKEDVEEKLHTVKRNIENGDFQVN